MMRELTLNEMKAVSGGECLSDACQNAQDWINDHQAEIDAEADAVVDSGQRILQQALQGASGGRYLGGFAGIPIGFLAGGTAGVIGELVRAGGDVFEDITKSY